ncbi:MAG TPA: hypothetical protein ENG16_02980 [Archaeoglobus sp.]|nr:hypothetical protein [Archaeoglobus sp.]
MNPSIPTQLMPDLLTTLLDTLVPLLIIVVSAIIAMKKSKYREPLAYFVVSIAFLVCTYVTLVSEMAWASVFLALLWFASIAGMIYKAVKQKEQRKIYVTLVSIIIIAFATVSMASLILFSLL